MQEFLKLIPQSELCDPEIRALVEQQNELIDRYSRLYFAVQPYEPNYLQVLARPERMNL